MAKYGLENEPAPCPPRLQGSAGPVPALSHEQGEGDVVLTKKGQGGPAQIVQNAATAGADEQLVGPAVGEPSRPVSGQRSAAAGARTSETGACQGHAPALRIRPECAARRGGAHRT
jgi:hypothetical protein